MNACGYIPRKGMRMYIIVVLCRGVHGEISAKMHVVDILLFVSREDLPCAVQLSLRRNRKTDFPGLAGFWGLGFRDFPGRAGFFGFRAAVLKGLEGSGGHGPSLNPQP